MKTFAEWVVTGDSVADTIGKVSVAAASGKVHCLTKAEVGISGAVTGAAGIVVTIKSGTATLYKTFIPAAAAIGTTKTLDFLPAIRTASGAELSLNTTAGGANCVATMNIVGYSLGG
jgi:hypothetical protein